MVQRRIINLESLRIPKDQRTAHRACASKEEMVSTLNLIGVGVLDYTSGKARIIISC